MQFKVIGRTGVKVSQLCCGTMSFGDAADAAESAAIFGRCRDAGLNFFDCADVYAKGRSEEILGDLIAGSRDEFVIVSKVFGPTGLRGINDRGASRRHVLRAVEASLRRLKTDRLDFYLLHRFDGETPIDETLRALEDLVRSGKVLYIGASNWAAWQIARPSDFHRGTNWHASSASSRCTICLNARPRSRSCRWHSLSRSASSPTARSREEC